MVPICDSLQVAKGVRCILHEVSDVGSHLVEGVGDGSFYDKLTYSSPTNTFFFSMDFIFYYDLILRVLNQKLNTTWHFVNYSASWRMWCVYTEIHISICMQFYTYLFLNLVFPK